MDSEKQAIQPTEEQASLSAPAANPAKTEEKPLTFDQKRELQSILQSIPLTLPPHLKKNVRRRRNANYARVAIFFTLWLIQSAYVSKEIFNSLYETIKGWTVKGCAHKAASTVVAAATTSTRDNTQIWKAIAITLPVMILIWVLLNLLVRPLTSTGRHIFFEGCAACFCVFQFSTAGLITAAQYMESGYKDYYNVVNSTLFLVLLCLTAFTSVSYLEEVEFLTMGMKALPIADAPKEEKLLGDSQV